MEFFKIALTGGPCAGKTRALIKIDQYFTAMGYKVFLLPETATELASWGITKDKFSSAYEYQKRIFTMQVSKEDQYGEQALNCGADKVLVVCDRGVPDNAAYLSPTEYYRLLCENGTSKNEVLIRYDAVFHLSSVSKISQKSYLKAMKNAPRVENYWEAKQIDDNLLYAWREHPHYYFIESRENFSEKIDNLVAAITDFLGKEPLKKTEKYVIKKPTFFDENHKVTPIEWYKIDEKLSVYAETDTKKYILVDEDGEEYTEGKRFIELIANVNNYSRKIPFTRHTFTLNNGYVYIDVFDSLDNAMMCVIKRGDEDVELPEGIEIVQKISK